MTIDETNRSETKYLLLRRAINLRDAINHNEADEKILLITDSIQSLAASLASAGSSRQGISNTMTLDDFNVRVLTPSVVASIEAGSCDAVLIECYQAWAREEISLTEDVLTAVIARMWKLSQEG